MPRNPRTPSHGNGRDQRRLPRDSSHDRSVDPAVPAAPAGGAPGARAGASPAHLDADPRLAEDTELNMTPMIDIVFQLIVFFLLTLRFRTVDERIESHLPNEGQRAGPVIPAPPQRVRVKVFRRGLETRDTTADDRTLIRLDSLTEWELPSGWRGRNAETPARVQAFDAVLSSLGAHVRERVSTYEVAAHLVRAEIIAPPPKGGAVPHGDVMAVLDVLLAEGLTNVVFEGTAGPN